MTKKKTSKYNAAKNWKRKLTSRSLWQDPFTIVGYNVGQVKVFTINTSHWNPSQFSVVLIDIIVY